MPQRQRRVGRVMIGGFPISTGPMGTMFRTQGGVVRLGSLGGGDHRAVGIPGPNGAADFATDLWPYSEGGQPWNASGPASAFDPPPIGTPLSTPVATPPGTFLPTPVPFGVADPTAQVQWNNPTTAAVTPIVAATPSQTPVLSLNYQRNLLIIQNNSTATAPDTTPVFYVSFNASVSAPGFGLALAAGIGIVFDIICPRDSVFISQVGGGGGTLVVAGIVVQGTYAPRS
jgi:hypothetical protein